ncbi:MAG: TolC family protein [Candidatus Eremiobacteraeota bacterium]|nr:TolC family protein [Candidatus Eremiobacteraeota bacterium]
MKLALSTLILLLLFASPCSSDEPAIEGPLDMKGAIERGFQNSPRLKIARAGVKSTQAETGEARSRLEPALSVNGVYSTGDMPMLISSAPLVMPQNIIRLENNTSGLLNAMIMAPLYTGGTFSNSVRARERDEAAASWEEKRVRLELAMEIKTSYLQALFLDESRKAYEELLALQNENVKRSGELYEAGKIPLLYLLRAKNERAAAESSINRLRAAFESERASLMALLGGDTRSAQELSEAFVPWESPGESGALRASLESHPVLLRFNEKIEAARREAHAVEGEYLPQVYVFGMGQAITPTRTDPNPGYSTGILASVAIGDGGSRKFRRDKALALLEGLIAEKEAARLTLEKELITAWKAMDAADNNTKLAEAALTEAAEVLRIAGLRYRSGKGISLEIIDAQWSQAKARLMRLEAIRDHNIAVARIKYITGTW